MLIKTTRYGEEELLEVPDLQTFDFSIGLGGFEDEHQYALVIEGDSPIEWLQSINTPSVGFPLLEPFLFYPEYGFELPDADAIALELEGTEDALIRCVLTLHDVPEETTANLLAPIVLNRRKRLGRQVVLQGTDLSMRYPVFDTLRLSRMPASA